MVEIKSFWVSGHPNTNHRPRFGESNVYMDSDYKTWMQQVGWAARAARIPTYPGRVTLSVVAYTKSHKSCDCDNLAKGVADGLEGIAYENDKLVYDSYTSKKPPHPEKGEGVLVTIVPQTQSRRKNWTRKETAFLGLLITNLGETVPNSIICNHVWGYQAGRNQIYNLVSRLKAAGVSLVNQRGVGYRLDQYPELDNLDQ